MINFEIKDLYKIIADKHSTFNEKCFATIRNTNKKATIQLKAKFKGLTTNKVEI